MEAIGVVSHSAVRWDTFSKKIYFNLDRDSVKGSLVLMKTADGKIDMHVLPARIAGGSQ